MTSILMCALLYSQMWQYRIQCHPPPIPRPTHSSVLDELKSAMWMPKANPPWWPMGTLV
jgi:hypothetical protein